MLRFAAIGEKNNALKMNECSRYAGFQRRLERPLAVAPRNSNFPIQTFDREFLQHSQLRNNEQLVALELEKLLSLLD